MLFIDNLFVCWGQMVVDRFGKKDIKCKKYNVQMNKLRTLTSQFWGIYGFICTKEV
jgi:hypothetical protein